MYQVSCGLEVSRSLPLLPPPVVVQEDGLAVGRGAEGHVVLVVLLVDRPRPHHAQHRLGARAQDGRQVGDVERIVGVVEVGDQEVLQITVVVELAAGAVLPGHTTPGVKSQESGTQPSQVSPILPQS